MEECGGDGKVAGTSGAVGVCFNRKTLGHSFAAAGDAEAFVEVFDVDMDGVGGEVEFCGYFFFAVTGEEVLEGVAHARGEFGGEVGGEFFGGDLGEHGLAGGGQFLAHEVAGERGAMVV